MTLRLTLWIYCCAGSYSGDSFDMPVAERLDKQVAEISAKRAPTMTLLSTISFARPCAS
jgi:hypothetical protein